MAIENMSFRPPTGFNMFQSNHEEQDHLPLPSHHQFHGTYVRVSTDNGSNNIPFFRRSVSLSGLEHGQEAPVMRVHGGGDDDLSDDGSQMVGERKKRLSLDQVKALEKSFERGNKLEPERKVQLARALGLQPRQVAIWFQNRRARWKTKQLERDYEGLRKQYDAMRSDNECLRVENEKLQSELVALKRRYNDRAPTIQKSNNGSHENRPISNSGHGHLGPLLRPTKATKQFHHGHNVVQEDSFCTMFGNGGGGMEDNQGFWSWNNTLTDHHHNQFH